MSYTINKTNGDIGAIVEDGTVDSTFAVKLIGKNYAGYGELQNENFLQLLENFANDTAPARKTLGQLWYDSSVNKIKVYNGNTFKSIGGAEVASGADEPTYLAEGDFWWNTTTKQIFVRNSLNAWTLVGPQAAGNKQTEMVSLTVLDDELSEHAVIAAVADGVAVYVISSDVQFVLDTQSMPEVFGEGFTVIHQGLTLAGLTPDAQEVPGTGYGVTDPSQTFRFFGTATDSDKLGGVSAADFVQKGDATFTTRVAFSDPGFTVGLPFPGNKGLLVDIDPTGGYHPRVRSYADTIVFQTKGLAENTPMVLNGLNILPGASSVSDIGSGTLKYNYVYANHFEGTASTSTTIKVSGIERYPAVISDTGTPNPDTIAVRDSDGNLNAVLFQGTATSSYFADLAEKYLADKEYEVGTVLMVGGDKEVTACQVGFRAVGPVSGSPGFMMNKDLEGGTYIALKGRVPVKVIGSVIKGQKLVAGQDGSAQVATGNTSDVFAIALETNNDVGVKLIEALVL